MNNDVLNNQENQQSENKDSKQQGIEIASFVLGVSALVLSLSVFSGMQLFLKLGLGITCAIVGLILGITSNKKMKNQMATTGIILSIIAMAMYLISMVACSACMIVACSALSTLY